MTLRIVCIQHADAEGPGAIAPWARERGHALVALRFDQGHLAPPADSVDLLVVLGGGMNVYETERFRWLAREKRFVRAVIDAGRPVLGICLGSQLVADALGAAVRRNGEREIGWHGVTKTAEGAASPFLAGWPDGAPLFQWHGDTFDIPDGAVHLARSAACAHQAFSWGDRVVGVQFHPEMTHGIAAAICASDADDLAPALYVQPAAEMLADPARFEAAGTGLAVLLDRLAALAGRDRAGAGDRRRTGGDALA
jgi:GMP synthase-like glutamine amidotransferase